MCYKKTTIDVFIRNNVTRNLAPFFAWAAS